MYTVSTLKDRTFSVFHTFIYITKCLQCQKQPTETLLLIQHTSKDSPMTPTREFIGGL